MPRAERTRWAVRPVAGCARSGLGAAAAAGAQGALPRATRGTCDASNLPCSTQPRATRLDKVNDALPQEVQRTRARNVQRAMCCTQGRAAARGATREAHHARWNGRGTLNAVGTPRLGPRFSAPRAWGAAQQQHHPRCRHRHQSFCCEQRRLAAVCKTGIPGPSSRPLAPRPGRL